MNFNEFKSTRKLLHDESGVDDEYWGYGLWHAWRIQECVDTGLYYVCGEEFTTLEEAEHRLFQMYQDELMLTEGY